jgi:hypothetical protein
MDVMRRYGVMMVAPETVDGYRDLGSTDLTVLRSMKPGMKTGSIRFKSIQYHRYHKRKVPLYIKGMGFNCFPVFSSSSTFIHSQRYK